MAQKEYLYPIWVRLWHWLNALLCLTLIVTGLSMQYANPDGGFVRFDISVSIHNVTGIILSASYIFFVLGNLFTRNGRYYRLEPIGLIQRLIKQGRYYAFGVFKKEKAPFPINKEQKFNPLQKVSYSFVMYLFVPLIIATGWGLLYPESILEDWLGMNWFIVTDVLHITSGFVISVFLIIHLYFATMGEKITSHYKSMITGYHEHHE